MNNGKLVTLQGDSPAAASTLLGTAALGTASDLGVDLAGFRSCRVEATLTGATGGTLDVYLQTSYDGGTTWTDYAHFAQVAGSAAASVQGFTSSSSEGDPMNAAGQGSTPSLGAGSARKGVMGSFVRLAMVAGAGTSAGATQKVTLAFGY